MTNTERKLLQLVADGFCYPCLDTSERAALGRLAARGYLAHVARKVYKVTEAGRLALATATAPQEKSE